MDKVLTAGSDGDIETTTLPYTVLYTVVTYLQVLLVYYVVIPNYIPLTSWYYYFLKPELRVFYIWTSHVLLCILEPCGVNCWIFQSSPRVSILFFIIFLFPSISCWLVRLNSCALPHASCSLSSVTTYFTLVCTVYEEIYSILKLPTNGSIKLSKFHTKFKLQKPSTCLVYLFKFIIIPNLNLWRAIWIWHWP